MSHALDARQQLAVLALVSGGTVSEAAERAGVDRRTVARWMRDPTFAAALDEARRNAYSAAMEAVRAASLEAVQALRDALKRGRDCDRIRAASVLLAAATKDVESERARSAPPAAVLGFWAVATPKEIEAVRAAVKAVRERHAAAVASGSVPAVAGEAPGTVADELDGMTMEELTRRAIEVLAGTPPA